MAKTSPRDVIDAEIEAAWKAGIMHCLVWVAKIDSAKANKLVDKVAERPNSLDTRKRDARERIVGAILATVVDEQAIRRPTQEALW